MRRPAIRLCLGYLVLALLLIAPQAGGVGFRAWAPATGEARGDGRLAAASAGNCRQHPGHQEGRAAGGQAVRVYSFETGGNGNHDMQSGLSASRPGSRAISTAIGYNQLLTTNSVELLAEQGHEFVKALTERAAQLSGAPRQAMDRKIAVLKRMVALARSGPDEWAQPEKLADPPHGWALHAMVLDIDVGPLLQTHKLLTSVIFARAKGYARPLTPAELAMINLTGHA